VSINSLHNPLFSPAEQAVLRVLAYAQVFRSGVVRAEVARYQLGTSFSFRELDAAGTSLRGRAVLKIHSVSSKKEAARKWRSVKEAIRFFRRFPGIRSVWVTGSVAVGNIHPEDDIDLMLVTDSGRLWWTRLFAESLDLLLNRPHRIRRRGEQDSAVADKWCCNLWLETTALELPPDQRSLYSAREVIQAVPVWQKYPGDAMRFLEANSWVRSWFPVGYARALERARSVRSSRLQTTQPSVWSDVVGRFSSLLNMLAFRIQQRRMRSYQQHEIITDKTAFFHPEERANQIQREYERILGLYLSSDEKHG
jgi:predicted nucleotidyltransferase